MFDAHCHLPASDSIYCTAQLLPQNIELPVDLSLAGISEAGLDRRFENRIPMEQQAQILLSILEHAKENGIPVTIHSVRATQRTMQVLEKVKPIRGTVLWHGYNGSPETARQLGGMGVIISIGPRFTGDIAKIHSADNMLVLETDYQGTSAQEHEQILENHYRKCAAILGTDICQLEEHCRETAKAFTDYKAARTTEN